MAILDTAHNRGIQVTPDFQAIPAMGGLGIRDMVVRDTLDILEVGCPDTAGILG